MNRRLFTIRMELLSPLHVGGKDEPFSEMENPVAAVGGRLCVPGPTLKGAYRSELERYLFDRFYDETGRRWQHDFLKPCVPTTEKLLGDEQKLLIRNGRFRGTVCAYPKSETICPACYVLGALGLVGFVSVPFLFSDTHKDQLYSSMINRATGTVTGGNRPYEAVLAPEARPFTGQLEVLIEDPFLGWKFGRKRTCREGLDPDRWIDEVGTAPEELLREFVIDRLNSIQHIGGYRSKGFGRVRITVQETTG